jgi:restriction endonuclease S subunit
LLSKIDARNGAFGIVPDEADGAIITGNFWTFDVDATKIYPKLLHYLTRSDAFIEFCAISSPGATNRRYLQEDLFLAQRVRVPGLIEEQQALCEVLDVVESLTRSQERDLKDLAKRAPVLLQAALHSVFGGKARSIDDEDSTEMLEEADVSTAE